MNKTIPFPVSGKGYGEAGASHRRRAMRGFNAQSGSPREDIDFNNQTLRERARMLYMAAPIASSAIKTPRTNVIGPGLKMNPKIDREMLKLSSEEADAWEKRVKAPCSSWLSSPGLCQGTFLS